MGVFKRNYTCIELVTNKYPPPRCEHVSEAAPPFRKIRQIDQPTDKQSHRAVSLPNKIQHRYKINIYDYDACSYLNATALL